MSGRLCRGGKRGNILAGWSAKEPPVLSAELGWAFVPDPECCLRRVEAVAEHQSSRLLEAEALLVLKRAQPCYRLEVQVKRGWAEPHVLGKRLNTGRLRKVVFEPADGPRNPLSRCSGRDDLP